MKNGNNGRAADIAVIGAGASGMMAAISAALYWKENNINNKSIVLIDKNGSAGKKILVTGNGRCNLTNLNQNTSCYMTCGQEQTFINQTISDFNQQDVIDFFEKYGMLVQNKNDYIYPKSMQAQTVADTLTRICDSLNIEKIMEEEVASIQFNKPDSSYGIQTAHGCICHARHVILATGSPASVNREYNGYKIAKHLGHSIIQPLPALCALEAEMKNVAGTEMGKSFFKNVTGVRCEVSCKAVIGNDIMAEEQGELQLTDYGLSGIVIFCLSRHIARAIHGGKSACICLDFLPDMTEQEILSFLYGDNCRQLTLHQALSGMMNSKLAKGLIQILSGKYYDVSLHTPVAKITREAMNGFIREVKNFKVGIRQTKGFERAQVCCGGVDLSQLNSENMESKKLPGLYMCGELLDVDGICGGYNLQWAWSSGYRAGKAAAISITALDTEKIEMERHNQK